MPTVVMADDGIAFDGATAAAGPLGGAETAFVALAEALAVRGHRVEVRNRCAAPLTHKGVHWAPLDSGVPAECDLYIGNRGHRMREVLDRADTLRNRGVHRHDPVGREELAAVLRRTRALLYRGDPGETFCLAVAEAQAMGVPAIVQPLGSLGERVNDGVSGR